MKTQPLQAILVSFFFILMICFLALDLKAEKSQSQNQNTGVLSFKVKNSSGEFTDLNQYQGNVLLIVNVASKCGFTSQYHGLQKLHEKYASQGFKILAFPCNDFGGQEPGTLKEIKAFCEAKFNITFEHFDKVKIRGSQDSITPLYQFLMSSEVKIKDQGPVQWNFEKFLVSQEGKVVKRFRSSTRPAQIANHIEKELKANKIKKESN